MGKANIPESQGDQSMEDEPKTMEITEEEANIIEES